MRDIKKTLENSIQKVEKWVESNKYRGYEPFDGLSSYIRPLTFGNLFAERILQQIVRQSPINLRPLMGVKVLESTKGRGFMAWGYLKMFKLTGNHRYKEKAINCLEWLIQNKSSKYSNYSWGNYFDFSSRSGQLPKSEPIIVWSSLIGQAFLDAYELISDQKYLKVALSICEWIKELPREVTHSGTCISYYAFRQSSIHNSNMLGAAMLVRTAKFSLDNEALNIAKEAMIYSCSRQLSDGAWYYGESANQHWIDNFHTAYNLDSLSCYINNTNDKTFENNLLQGYQYFIKTFFEENGRPKYYHNKTYPVDIQCAAQAIDTLALFSESDKSALKLALTVAEWTIDNMQDEAGYFYYRELPWIKVKTPMLHWGQATMYKGLTHLLTKL